MENNKKIGDTLWKICDQIRDESKLIINESQPYFLGFMFYKFLSEKITARIENMLENRTTYKNLYSNVKLFEDVKRLCKQNIGYFIDYKDTYRSVVDDCSFSNENLVDRLTQAFSHIEDSTIGSDSAKDFRGLFGTIRLDADALGHNQEERIETLMHILKSLDIKDLSFDNITGTDVLGDTYEFIIGKFASESGQKAGEFYTPAPVSELLSKIVTHNLKSTGYIYDPTCGSGSLLIKAKQNVEKFAKLFGQEKSTQTFNMARMNMFLHDIRYDDFQIENGNTLKDNRFSDYAQKIDIVLANPPFSTGWNPEELKNDPRFSEYPKMAPKSTADFAFVQHMLYMLKPGGRCGVIVPHGVLFRGNAEEAIRKYIVGHKKWLRAVIGLPANMFFNASIPACILYFEKQESNADVLFIEASKEFLKNKNKNTMTPENVQKIYETFADKKEIDKFSRLVSLKEIEENEFNLNITRYIDTFEEEPEIDIVEVNRKLKEVDAEIAKTEKEIQAMIAELVETKNADKL